MSTKAHFICENGIEGYEETAEPQTNFWGDFSGFNVYLIIDNYILHTCNIKEGYLFVETKNTEHLPKKFKICVSALISVEWNDEDTFIHLKGDSRKTKDIIKANYDVFE